MCVFFEPCGSVCCWLSGRAAWFYEISCEFTCGLVLIVVHVRPCEEKKTGGGEVGGSLLLGEEAGKILLGEGDLHCFDQCLKLMLIEGRRWISNNLKYPAVVTRIDLSALILHYTQFCPSYPKCVCMLRFMLRMLFVLEVVDDLIVVKGDH